VALRALAPDEGERTVGDPDDVGQGDRVGRAGEAVATVGPPAALDHAGPPQLDQDAVQERARDSLRRGDLVGLDGAQLRSTRQYTQRPQRVVRSRRDLHATILTYLP
jgi:hypothetical protein